LLLYDLEGTNFSAVLRLIRRISKERRLRKRGRESGNKFLVAVAAVTKDNKVGRILLAGVNDVSFSSLQGSLSKKHYGYYLDGFTFRFNRRT
jgi:hypothetical protein